MLRDRVNRDVIARFVSRGAFDKAQTYVAEGRVSAIEIDEDGSHISARVRGSGRNVYDTTIVVKSDDLRITRLSSTCSCPMVSQCKHVAATLLAALVQERLDATGGIIRAAPSAPAPIAISGPTQSWLDRMGNAMRGDAYPPELPHRLLYVLHPSATRREMGHLAVALVSIRLRKDGSFPDKGIAATIPSDLSRAPKFYRDADIDILQSLARQSVSFASPDNRRIRSTDLLRRIVATGRAYWLDHDGEPVSWGEPKPGRIDWRLVTASELRPYLTVDGAEAMNAEPPAYADPAAGTIGLVELGMRPRLAYELLLAPPIPVAEAGAVADRLSHKLPSLRHDMLPAPQEPPGRIDEAPTPVLRLCVARELGSRYYEPGPRLFARLGFRYGAVEIGAFETAVQIERVHDGRLLEIVRHPKRENAAGARLESLGFLRVAKLFPYASADLRRDLTFAEPEDWLAFLHKGADELRVHGFEIEIADDFPFQLAQSDGALGLEIESSGVDWFELALGIEVEGQRQDLAPVLAEMIRNPAWHAQVAAAAEAGGTLFLPLDDGRRVAIAATRFAPLLLAIAAAGANGASLDAAGRVKLSRADMIPLIGYEEGDFILKGADRLRGLARSLQGKGLTAPDLPPDFAGTLRPYQAQGVAWLDLLAENGFGGILADDMGLGKTVQVLALLALRKARNGPANPILIVAPTSLMANWASEARKFAPALKLLVLHGTGRKQAFDMIAEHDVVLTTYPLIARDHAVLLAREWHMAILDEAQTIKNPNATTTRLLAGIKARHRFCLTGTPMENHLGELWSLMNFANPGFLGEKAAFGRAWRNPIEKNGDTARSTALARRIKPFLLRRTKSEVAADLPEKIEIVETIALESKQRDLYDSIRLAMSAKVREALRARGLAKSHIILLEALLRLRQTCCDPRLLKLKDGIEYQSAKFERLLEMVDELRSEGRKIIVFSQFTSMLDLIRAGMDEAGLRYSLLTGDTKDRPAAIAQFQSGATDVFLISLKAGGVGLNLTAADTVIIFDPWWNPAVEEQAIDRAYRIGQDKTVFVYRLVAAGTIEEKMGELKARKRALADGIIGSDGQIGTALTEADVVALFE